MYTYSLMIELLKLNIQKNRTLHTFRLIFINFLRDMSFWDWRHGGTRAWYNNMLTDPDPRARHEGFPKLKLIYCI